MSKFRREHKDLGRGVSGYDQDVWDQHKSRIVAQGNYAKFTQNEMMGQRLLDTGEKVRGCTACFFLAFRSLAKAVKYAYEYYTLAVRVLRSDQRSMTFHCLDSCKTFI